MQGRSATRQKDTLAGQNHSSLELPNKAVWKSITLARISFSKVAYIIGRIGEAAELGTGEPGSGELGTLAMETGVELGN